MRKLNCGNVGAGGGGMVCTQKTKGRIQTWMSIIYDSQEITINISSSE